MAENEENTTPGGRNMDEEPDSPMDSTSMDLGQKAVGRESTRTELRIDLPHEERKPLAKDQSIFAPWKALWAKFFPNRLKQPRPVSSSTSSSYSRRPISPALIPYVNLWIAPPPLNLKQKLIFYFSRLVFVSFALFLFAFLYQGLLVSIRAGTPFQWVLLIFASLALIFSLLSIYLCWQPVWVFGFPLLSLLAVLIAQIFLKNFLGSSFLPIKMGGISWEAAHLIGLLFIFELVFLLLVFPQSWLGKALPLAVVAYVLLGLALIISSGKPLAASWQGVSFFKILPFYLRPMFVGLHLFLPLFFLVSLISLFLARDSTERGWIILNTCLLFFSSAVGLGLLQEGRVPNVLSLIVQPQLKAGAVSFDVDGRSMVLRTANDFQKDMDDGEDRYKLSVSRISQPSAAQQEYSLEVKDVSDLPIYYLEKNDFVLLSEGKKVEGWNLKDAPESKQTRNKQGALYSLTFGNEPRSLNFAFGEPKPEYSAHDKIKFSLKENSPEAHSYIITIDDQKILEKEITEGQKEFFWSPAGISAGKHVLKIEMISADGKSFAQTQEINVKEVPALQVLAPLAGDYFSDTLRVYAQLFLPEGEVPSRLKFLIDDQEIDQKNEPPFEMVLNTASLIPGNHVLKVIAEVPIAGADSPKEYSQLLSLIKGPHPIVSLIRPGFGEFVNADTPVEVSVEGEEGYDQLDFLVDDKPVLKWTQAPYFTTWDTTSLEEGSHVVTIKGSAEGGMQSSDTVVVSTGTGKIKVLAGVPGDPNSAPSPTASNATSSIVRFEQVVFVLDASNSEADEWNGRIKWDWQRDLLSLPKVTAQLSGSKVGVVVMGAGSSFSKRDCKDAKWALDSGTFDSQKAVTAFSKVKPKGISALFAALKLALEAKPQKIVVLTDDADTCSASIPADLKAMLQESEASLDILPLDSISQRKLMLLADIAKAGKGSVIPITSTSVLEEKFLGSLTPVYQVIHKDQIMLAHPIDGKELPLLPGTYIFKVSSLALPEQEINVRNGLMTIIYLMKDQDGAHLLQDFQPLY
jgi:hypothetical protein